MASSRPAAKWGNAEFYDMAVGETLDYRGRAVTLVAAGGNSVTVDVDGDAAVAGVARCHLPVQVNGVRVIGSCLRLWREIALECDKGNLPVSRDALLCLSDSSGPIADPDRFVFPIDRSDGWEWTCEEESHMHMWLGSTWFRFRPRYVNRFHEGVDLAMHDARAGDIHALVAVEDATVQRVWNPTGTPPETCVLLESAREPGLFYAYQHLNFPTVVVKEGQKVGRGEKMGYIWGDNAWGHLHFAVSSQLDLPRQKDDAYRCLLNAFPFLYELYHGGLEVVRPPRVRGDWLFGQHRYDCRNDAGELAFNNPRAAYYNDVSGYGWSLDDWMSAGLMHNNRTPEAEFCNVYGLRTMWDDGDDVDGGLFRAECPEGGYQFAVRVEPGAYLVQATVGDRTDSSAQCVRCNGMEMGTFELGPGERAKTPQKVVKVEGDRLVVSLDFVDERRVALHRLAFERA